LWNTASAAKPLALFDGRLVAQADPAVDSHVLPIVIQDTKNGRVVFKTSLPMPAGVSPSISDTLGTAFSVEARVKRDNLIVSWNFRQQTISGIARLGPTPERIETGAASIDLKTHHVETLTAQQAAALRGASGPAKLPRSSGSEVFQSPPQQAGRFFIATEPGAPGSGGDTVLKRWHAETGAPMPDVKLGPEFNAAIPSADGLLFLTARAAGADAVGMQNYLWSIYSLASGQRLAEIRMTGSAAPFFIRDRTLIYESRPYNRRVNGAWLQEPLELRAVDVKTGREIWKRAFRDTAYRGPFPPMP
jgi:hypothetical protein